MKRFFVCLFATVMFCGSLQCKAQNDSIPFLYRGHLYVHATINDTVDCNVLFDTGAADMFGADSVWLSHSQWVPENYRYAMAGGGAGATQVKVIVDPTKVHIGNVEEHYGMVPIFKLRDVVDCHIDAIWGIKHIADYPFEINFEHKYLKQYKEGKPDTEGYMRLPIKYENNRILFQAETNIGGRSIKGWYLMDTGSGGTVDFTTQTTKQHRIADIPGKRYITDISQFGLGDKEQEYYVDMLSNWIVVGNDTIFGKPISYIPEGAGAFSKGPYLGVVGNSIWSKYNIIIDAKNNMLYLRRFKEDTPLVPTYSYSFRNRTDIGSGWIVSALVRDDDAIGAGMALGDTIVTVNGRPVTDYSWEEEYNIDEQAKHILEIIGADGQKRQITLEAKLRW